MCDVTVIENKPRVYFISVLLGVRSYRCTDYTLATRIISVEIDFVGDFDVDLRCLQAVKQAVKQAV